jgi:hypothetical protein
MDSENLDVAKDIDKPIVFGSGRRTGEVPLKNGAFHRVAGRRLKLRTGLPFLLEYRRVYRAQPQGKKTGGLKSGRGSFSGWRARKSSNWRAGRQWKAASREQRSITRTMRSRRAVRDKDRAKREELAWQVAKTQASQGALIGDFQSQKRQAAEKAEEFEQIKPWPEPVLQKR